MPLDMAKTETWKWWVERDHNKHWHRQGFGKNFLKTTELQIKTDIKTMARQHNSSGYCHCMSSINLPRDNCRGLQPYEQKLVLACGCWELTTLELSSFLLLGGFTAHKDSWIQIGCLFSVLQDLILQLITRKVTECLYTVYS